MIFQVDVPIFETAIICSHSCNASDAMDEFYHWEGKRSRIELPEEDSKHGSVVTFKGNVFVWIKDPTEYYRFVFHELVHVFHSICELKGIVNKDEEFEAYFMSWMKTNISDVIMDHLKEIEKPKISEEHASIVKEAMTNIDEVVGESPAKPKKIIPKFRRTNDE